MSIYASSALMWYTWKVDVVRHMMKNVPEVARVPEIATEHSEKLIWWFFSWEFWSCCWVWKSVKGLRQGPFSGSWTWDIWICLVHIQKKVSFYCRLECRWGPAALIASRKSLKRIMSIAWGECLLFSMVSIRSHSGISLKRIRGKETPKIEVLFALLWSILLIKQEADDRQFPPSD